MNIKTLFGLAVFSLFVFGVVAVDDPYGNAKTVVTPYGMTVAKIAPGNTNAITSNVVSGAYKLYSFHFYNTTTNNYVVSFYDQTNAVATSSTIYFPIIVPAGSGHTYVDAAGIPFANGIAYGWSSDSSGTNFTALSGVGGFVKYGK